jgi:hypothetical protein
MGGFFFEAGPVFSDSMSVPSIQYPFSLSFKPICCRFYPFTFRSFIKRIHIPHSITMRFIRLFYKVSISPCR